MIICGFVSCCGKLLVVMCLMVKLLIGFIVRGGENFELLFFGKGCLVVFFVFFV